MYRAAESFTAIADESIALVHRLDDAGRIAGRLAHDFDNILAGVLGFAELTQAAVEVDSPAARFLTELLQVARGAMDVTRQLHQFSRCGQSYPGSTRLSDVWDACTPAIKDGLPAEVRVEADFADDLPLVAIADEPLGGVLRNLVRNAAEATDAGGLVAVSARVVAVTHAVTDALPAALRPGSFVEVTVADNGPGFRPDVLARVGREPFVTTKARRRGLGLPTVCRVLYAHGGDLRIQSSPGKTAVVVYLPSADPSPPAREWVPARRPASGHPAPLEVVSP